MNLRGRRRVHDLRRGRRASDGENDSEQPPSLLTHGVVQSGEDDGLAEARGPQDLRETRGGYGDGKSPDQIVQVDEVVVDVRKAEDR